jgi:hypothetical protein
MIISALMPTEHILELMVAERDRLNRAIEALQEPGKKRGRPSGNSAGARRGRTAAQNKAQSERMKAYWAKRRREEAKAAK